MYVLGVETAGERGGVAVLSEDGDIGSEALFYAGRKHMELLSQAVAAALALAGTTVEDLGLIAVDVGPGSFTGLRIGIAFAKAMAQSLALSLVGVRQTDVMGLPVANWWPGRVAVWIHDRREFLYHAWVSGDRAGNVVAVPIEEAIEKLRGREDVLVVGSGAVRFADRVREAVPTARIAGELWAYPSPAEVARQGLERFGMQGPSDPLSLEPLYVEPPVADMKEA